MQMIPRLWLKVKRNWRAFWCMWKRRVKKFALNLTFKKLKLWHLVPALHGKYMGKQWKQWQTIFLGSKITADGDCSHEIKRHLLLGRKVMTNLETLKGRDITLPTKVRLVKAMVFPVVMYGCESWTVKKAECWRTDAFELWCWRRLLRVPWTARRSNHSIQNAVSPELFIGKTDIELKLQYCGHLMRRIDSLEMTWCWERLKAGEEKGTTEDEMLGWHDQLNGHEFEQAPGVGDRQGSLTCCSPWGHK